MERDGSKEPVPYNGIGSGPSLPRRVFAPWVVPSALLPQGDSLWLAPSAHVCGRLLGREAGRGPTSWGTIAHLFVFYKGGVTGAADSGARPLMGTDGFVLACALHQRRVWLGLRRCPTGPPSNVFWYRGTPPVPPAGAAPPAPCLGEGSVGVFPLGALGCFLARGRGWDRCEARSSAATARS